MSEKTIASASDCARAASLLRASEHVQKVEFYVNQFENRDPELCCRIHEMYPLKMDVLKSFAAKMNEAIEPAKAELAESLQSNACSAMQSR